MNKARLLVRNRIILVVMFYTNRAKIQLLSNINLLKKSTSSVMINIFYIEVIGMDVFDDEHNHFLK